MSADNRHTRTSTHRRPGVHIIFTTDAMLEPARTTAPDVEQRRYQVQKRQQAIGEIPHVCRSKLGFGS
jgi:hypothetical protein